MEKIAVKKRREGVKSDQNFLEYFVWGVENSHEEILIDGGQKLEQIILKTEHGYYRLKAANGIPSRLDKAILDHLLFMVLSNKNKEAREVVTTRYAVARAIFSDKKNLGAKELDRVMDALRRWVGLISEFNGSFYENGEYTTRIFNIIYNVNLAHKTGRLSIKFNEDFLHQHRESKYFRFFNVSTAKKIKQPLAARLYELLPQHFFKKSQWPIGLDKLAEKLTISKRKNTSGYYPSDVVPLIKRALEEYNKFAEVKLTFEFEKSKNNLCIFKKSPAIKSLPAQ